MNAFRQQVGGDEKRQAGGKSDDGGIVPDAAGDRASGLSESAKQLLDQPELVETATETSVRS
jgi:hypothetical protein